MTSLRMTRARYFSGTVGTQQQEKFFLALSTAPVCIGLTRSPLRVDPTQVSYLYLVVLISHAIVADLNMN